MKECYLVQVLSGTPYESTYYTKFITLDKKVAIDWVTKYNRIIKNHKSRIIDFVESNAFMKSEKEYSLHEYVYYNNPLAYWDKIELR